MIYHDYPIPAESSKGVCSVYGCNNRSEVLVVIDFPHRSLFECHVWGSKTDETKILAPATGTVAFCGACARRMAMQPLERR